MSTMRAPGGADGRARTGARVAVVAALWVAAAVALWAYGNRHDFFDLRIYDAALRWWVGGHELYSYSQPDEVQGRLYFTYPPFAALLLRPMAFVPLGVTITVFTLFTVVAVAVTTWWLVRPLADARHLPRWFVAGLAVPLVFVLESTRETLTFGQINMLLVVLILGDLLLAVPGRWRLAGVGVGLATAIKLFPGLFIVYLLVTRRWRAALVASGTAAAVSLLAFALLPRESWQFWTEALWATERVGRTDYTGNQSILGMISRFAAPHEPPRPLWLAVVAVVAVVGLWRAAAAVRAGDELTGIALTGLTAALISPITWPHHVYWFVPALVVLVAAALPPGAARPRWGPLAAAGAAFAVAVFGVVSFIGDPAARFQGVAEFVVRNAYVLLALALVAALPVRAAAVRTHEARQPEVNAHH
jgi:alpha-1,2-mannosyltransferase